MNLQVVAKPLAQVAADWLIAGAWENEAFSGPLAELDAALGGLLSNLRERGDLTGKAKELVPLWSVANLAAPRLLVVGLGPKGKADAGSLVACAAAAAKSLTGKAYQSLAMAIPTPPPGCAFEDVVYAL